MSSSPTDIIVHYLRQAGVDNPDIHAEIECAVEGIINDAVARSVKRAMELCAPKASGGGK